ncbi:MAG: AraC family transcriptional regulator, partial [Flavobacteriales bacterium]|nr:AraC family transcriptional regulator [Flavobacteriales bacterium]
LLADVNATQSFYQAGNYSLEIAQNIKSLKDFNGSDLIRTNFLGAKSLEMLAHALNQYVDDKENEKPLLIRASEVQLVDKAKEFILTRFSENINLDEIAQFAGLPIHKLQEGFKMVFGCTVNKYIQDTRLDHAFKLLGQGDLNVNEVVNAIGFSSRSHFAKIFKERFGLSPKRFMLSRNKAQ